MNGRIASMPTLEWWPATTQAGVVDEFAAGLAETYRHFGVGEAVNELSAAVRPHVTHVVVRDGDRIVGGARIHRAAEGCPLPAARALTGQPLLRAALVASAARIGAPVELAALWTARDRPEYRGLGRLVALTSIAAAAVEGAPRAVTFSHHNLAPMLSAIGMRTLPGVPTIPYPSDAYRSTIWEVAPGAPVNAEPFDREQIETITRLWTHDASPIEVVARPVIPVGELPWVVVPERRRVAA